MHIELAGQLSWAQRSTSHREPEKPSPHTQFKEPVEGEKRHVPLFWQGVLLKQGFDTDLLLLHRIPVKGEGHLQRNPPGCGKQVPPLKQALLSQTLISCWQWWPRWPVPSQLQEYPVPPEGSSIHEAPFKQGFSAHEDIRVAQSGPVKPGWHRQTSEFPLGKQTPPFWQNSWRHVLGRLRSVSNDQL